MKQKAMIFGAVLALISSTGMAESRAVLEQRSIPEAVLTNPDALTKFYMTNPSRTSVAMFQALYNEQVKTNQMLERLIALMERQAMHRH